MNFKSILTTPTTFKSINLLRKEDQIKKVRSCVLEERRELNFHKAK